MDGYLKWIFIVIIMLLIIFAVYRIINKIKVAGRKLYSSTEAQMIRYAVKALQTGDINDKLSSTPKSLSSMNSIYLPQIQKDFPEFSWVEFKPIIESTILSMLKAIDERNALLVKENDFIYKAILYELEKTKIPNYKDIRIHDTVIKSYYKKEGTCYIITETSVEYFSFIRDNEKIIQGYDNRKKQTIYESELIYIQDANKVKNRISLGVTCPNCGAPIKMLGVKFCEYCGSAVETVNSNVWHISSIKEK